MTILKKILIFNKPVEELECDCCRGSGKKKTSPIHPATGMFGTFIGFGLVIYLMHTITKQTPIDFLMFGLFFILAIIALMELKEQNARIN